MSPQAFITPPSPLISLIWANLRRRVNAVNPLTIGTEVGQAGIAALATLHRDFSPETKKQAPTKDCGALKE